MSAATRNLKFAKLSAESGRIDDVASQIAKTEASLQALSDAEKAPIVAELDVLRKLVDDARRAEKLRSVVDRAKRNLRTARMALDDKYYDHVEERIEAALRDPDLNDLSDADKAPLLAEVAELREGAMRGLTRRSAEALVRSIEMNLRGCRPNYPSQNAELLARVIDVLDSEKAKQVLDPAVVERYRTQVDDLRDADIAANRQGIVDSIASQLKAIGDQLAPDAERASDEQSVRGTWSSLASRITAAHATVARLPNGDRDAAAFTQQLDAFAAQLDAAIATHERDSRVGWLATNWAFVKLEATGWEAEQQIPTWEDVWDRHQGDLMMPNTVDAIAAYSLWLDNVGDDAYKDDATVVALLAEATALRDAAVEKLQRAYDSVMAGGERAAMPTRERDPERLAVELVQFIEPWFGRTRYAEDNRRRAVALHDTWTRAVAAYEQKGVDLYNALTAEADAAWPAIEASISVELGFDPTEPEHWCNRRVRFTGVYNRIGWDYNGNYHFAMAINGVPVAGHYETAIAQAVMNVERRTRKNLDEHTRWDVIGVIRGRGSIDRRKVRELGHTRLESWDPVPCVVMQIIALHAGPIAIGPR
jgi:hypothetical protein